jgi:hypothetical protein
MVDGLVDCGWARTKARSGSGSRGSVMFGSISASWGSLGGALCEPALLGWQEQARHALWSRVKEENSMSSLEVLGE